MDLGRIHELIAAVCPIHGVSADGRIDFKPEATAQQRLDAATAWTNADKRPRRARAIGNFLTDWGHLTAAQRTEITGVVVYLAMQGNERLAKAIADRDITLAHDEVDA